MDSFPVCTHCGFTLGEYRSRGLLGCPHCYASFGEALQADLLWMHHALDISSFEAGGSDSSGAQSAARAESRGADPENLARWKRNLAEALKVENYGEAARLRLLIQGASHSGGETPGEGRTSGGLGLA
jgi:protein arginine kinase activator